MQKKVASLCADALCATSIVGIWPRFIEPRLLYTSQFDWHIDPVHSHLDGLTILHFSDLHFHRNTSTKFLKKVIQKARALKPDLIFFTGDFLCYAHLEDSERLKEFLNHFQAPLGCFAVFGNHDYAHYVSRNKEGIYDVLQPASPLTGLQRGLRTIFRKSNIKGMVSQEVLKVGMHQELLSLLKETPFVPLENRCNTLSVGLNIVGVGEYGLGRFHPETAFIGYDRRYLGIVLAHNPDTFIYLQNFPGDLILSGHSHGEQIHFPFPSFMRQISRKLTRLENLSYTRGYYREKGKTLYINRGLGCHKPLRFCSPPELTYITIKKHA